MPGGTDHHHGDRGLEPGVGIRDHQLRSGQPAGFDRAEEGSPERAVLGVPDAEAEDLTTSVGGDAGGDHDRLGHHAGAFAVTGATDSGFAVGRVEEDVGEVLLAQRPIGEPGNLLVEIGADPRDLGLG